MATREMVRTACLNFPRSEIFGIARRLSREIEPKEKMTTEVLISDLYSQYEVNTQPLTEPLRKHSIVWHREHSQQMILFRASHLRGR